VSDTHPVDIGDGVYGCHANVPRARPSSDRLNGLCPCFGQLPYRPTSGMR
jgi:hypothetical protein